MGAFLDDAARFQHEDAVCLENRRQSVRDDKRGAALHELLECSLNKGLAFGVERGRCLVE